MTAVKGVRIMESIDDVIASLMSMGFEYTDCQDAITFGKNTVQAAVEWLVAGKPGFRTGPTPDSSPSLRLRPQTSEFGTSSVPFVKPNPIQSDTSSTSHDQTNQSEVSKRSQSDVTQDASDHSEALIVSRMHLSNEQRKVKEGFEQKQRDEAKKSVMLEKKRQREEHARVLKEIAADREKKKLTMSQAKPGGEGATGPGATGSETGQSVAMATSSNEQQAATKSDVKSDTCLLQIRLPDGRSLRHSFSSSSTLRDVWNFTSEQIKLSMAEYMFIQPFPHHEFSREEMLQSLTDLKLTPTGSLVLQKKTVTQSTDSKMEVSEGAQEEEREESPMDHSAPPPAPPPQSHVHAADPRHYWGRGNVMEGEGQPDEEAAEAGYQPLEEDISDDDDDLGPNMVIPGGDPGAGFPPGFPAGRGRGFIPGGMPGMPFPGGGMGIGGGGRGRGMFGMDEPFDHGGQVFGGVGQRLVPEGHPDNNDRHHQRSVRDLALERAQARQVHAHQVAALESSSAHSIKPVQSVPTLLLCCLKHVSHRLNDPRNQILSLGGISEDMAQVIIAHLLKEKLLKNKTLNAFIPCYLRRLILDCYPYVTNDLLASIRLHTNLSQLSLSSCPLITDGGLQCLHTLKKLKKLNLSCCRQITNKVIPVLKGMPNLAALNLEGTGVTDLGVIEYLSTRPQHLQHFNLYQPPYCPMPNLAALNLEGTGVTDSGVIEYLSTRPQHLQHLNLNRTEVTHAIISHLIGLTTLKSLSLEDTKVASLTGVQELGHLESLNVARTLIVTESLLCLPENNPALVSLNIANTDNVNGDQGLQNLTGLHLQLLNLPSRHTTTNLGMKYISGFPLVSLDLTNFIFVGDEGMEHIGKITSLKKLLLCNTKLTDEGMIFLAGLTNLEVLDIDRTMVTNDGANIIGGFTSLLELSMVSTGVTSRFLLSGALNNCINLTKVNLSKTMVTNKGLKSVVLPSLQLLNLDGTKVRQDIQDLMATNCPRLTQVSLRNLEPYSLEDQEADAENMEL